MLDNVLNSLKRGVDRARSRGEEATQAARLRFEIFQLNRELDALYGRLGRAYHSGADLSVLQSLRDDIQRVDDEIVARERLIAEIGATPKEDVQGEAGVAAATSTTVVRTTVISTSPLTAPAAPQPPVQDAALPADAPVDVTPALDVPSAASVYRAKRQEEDIMPDDDRRYVTDESGLTPAQKENPLIANSHERDRDKDKPNEDYQERVDEGQRVSHGTKTDASLHGSSAPIPPLGTLAGNDQGIDRAPVTATLDTEEVHEHGIAKEERNEARKASRDPDPLD